MNPLLVSGAIAVGERLIGHIVGSKPPEPPKEAEFTSALSRAQNIPREISSLRQAVAAYGAKDAIDLNNLKTSLGNELIHQPELQSFMMDVRLDEPLKLEIDESGFFTLRNGSGKSISFSENSELGHQANQYIQVRGAAQLAQSAPGAPVSQVLTYLENNPVKSGSAYMTM